MTYKKVAGTIISKTGIYHLKIRVPAQLRQLYAGKTILEKSLKTRDWQVAQFKVAEVRVEMDRLEHLGPEERGKVLAVGGIRAFEDLHRRGLVAARFRTAGELSEAEYTAMGYSADEAILAQVKSEREDSILDAGLATEERVLRAIGSDVAKGGYASAVRSSKPCSSALPTDAQSATNALRI